MKELFRHRNLVKTDFYRKAKGLFFGKTTGELQEMIKPGEIEKLPVFIAILISAFIKDVKSGVIDTDINTFLDKVFGEKEINEKK